MGVREHMAKIWQKTPIHLGQSELFLTIKITALAAAVITLFSQDLTIIFADALQSEATSHILAIPFIFAYLIYRKRKILRAVVPLENKNQPKEIRYLPATSGLLLSATAILLYWYGSYTFTPLEYHIFAMPIFLAGLILILFNSQTLRQLAFPIAFLMFLTPPPSDILFAIGATLAVVSAEASNAIANLMGIPSMLTSEYGNPTIIVTRPDGSTIPFTVDVACSGIYSLIGFLIFAVLIAYIIRDKPWKKLAIITAGVLLTYSLNILRITIILMLGYYYGQDLALQVFHLLGGWMLIFLGTIALLTISEKILKAQILPKTEQSCTKCNSQPQFNQDFCPSCGRLLKPHAITLNRIDAAKIASITVTVILLLSLQTPVFALTQAYPIVVTSSPSGQKASTNILPQIPDYTLAFLYRDTKFEIRAKQDMSLVYSYTPINKSKQPVWVAIEIASTRSSLHQWEACLIKYPISRGYNPRVAQIELKDIQLTENPPIIGRFFAFQYVNNNETQAVLYWYEKTTFTINQTLQQKYVKISLITYPENVDDLKSIESQMVTLAKPIVNFWQPLKTWSQMAMLISQNGIKLVAANSLVLISIVSLYALEIRKQKKANANAYHKLSKINRQIIDAVRETEKSTTPTLDNIVDTYQKITQKPMDGNKLLQELTELEKITIIKSHIVNRQDQPIQIWKSHI